MAAFIQPADPAGKSINEFGRTDICSFLLRRLHNHHKETYHHSLRVAGLCAELSAFLGMHEGKREVFLRSALLHDIGKIRIGKSLLDNQDALSHEDWIILKNHCLFGVEMLEGSQLAEHIDLHLILYHHENLDGTGYYGLTNNELSLELKIIRVADSFDAMTGPGACRQIMSISEAFEELYCWMDILYDRHVVEALHELRNCPTKEVSRWQPYRT